MNYKELEDPPLKHLFDGSTGAGLGGTDEVIRMTAGAPGPDLLKRCVGLFEIATRHCLEKEKDCANLFQYGSSPGSWEFREQLALFLSKHYNEPVKRADLILTCGATHGLQLVLASLLSPRGVIFVEEVTYMIALDVFKEYSSMTVVPVKVDTEGLDVFDLEIKAKQLKSNGSWEVNGEKPFWAMLYCIPVYHNPTGVTLSEDRCHSLIKLAQHLQFLVFCDDVYNLLSHHSELHPPQRLFAKDRGNANQSGGHVISNGSFSKILAPGVRVGWLETPPRLATKLRASGLLRSSGAVNHYMSGLITSLMELGLQSNHLSFLAGLMEERMRSICSIMRTNLPPNCQFYTPQGGYYVWLQLPMNINAETFTKWSEKNYCVAAFPGNRFSPNPEKFKHCLRIAVAFHDQSQLDIAVKRLCKALHAFIDQNNPS